MGQLRAPRLPDEDGEALAVGGRQLALADAALEQGSGLGKPVLPAVDAQAAVAPAAGLEVLAMEWMPRITRAQSMDVLSSQSNLAGYKAVIDAASAFGRAFPMMMTAAGTVSPARASPSAVAAGRPAASARAASCSAA